MAHRADAIVSAFVAAIGATLTPTGVKVYPHRRLTLDTSQDELPAVSVDFGDDESDFETDEGSSTLLSKLAVRCTVIVALAEEQDVREQLLALCRSIHIAIMADRDLGLSFFARAYRVGESDHEIEANESGPIVGTRTSNWLVHYFMNISDPGD